MADCKRGARSSALPKRAPHALMIALSKAVTDEEMQIAATYFAALKSRANIGVVETGNIGQISVANWMLAGNKSGAKQAIDQRIIELPENPKHVERSD